MLHDILFINIKYRPPASLEQSVLMNVPMWKPCITVLLTLRVSLKRRGSYALITTAIEPRPREGGGRGAVRLCKSIGPLPHKAFPGSLSIPPLKSDDGSLSCR